MKYFKIALFLCWALIGIGAAGASQNYQQKLEEGREFLVSKNFGKATKAFKAARKAAAKDVDVDADVAEILREILESEPVSDDKFSNSVRIEYCDLRHGLDSDGEELPEGRNTDPVPVQADGLIEDLPAAVLEAIEESIQQIEGSSANTVSAIGVSRESTQPIEGSIQGPKKIRSVAPQRIGDTRFPEARGRFHDTRGGVLLRAVINKMGCVTRLEVVDSTAYPTLNRRAMDAASRWVFKPATANGKPIAVPYQLVINFQAN